MEQMMTDPIIKQARKLLEIEEFYARNSTRSVGFFHTTLRTEMALTATQRVESQALRVAYAAAQTAFVANQTDETATRMLEAHENESNFKRRAGFQFESLSAFYSSETLEYAHQLLTIENFLLQNPQEFLPFFMATQVRETVLTPEQSSVLNASRETYVNARLRFQKNETPNTAVKMSNAYDRYVETKEKLRFAFSSPRAYYERALPVNPVTIQQMAPLVHPRAVEVNLRRSFADTDMARDAEEIKRIADKSIRR
jgi:hypothetical protein